MIYKTMQPTLINQLSNSLPYNAKFTKCGDSENSFLLKSYAFSNNCLLCCSHGKGDFRLATVVYCMHGESSMRHHKQMISGEEMHTLQLIIHLCLALWLLIQWLVYKLIYNVLLQKKIMNLIKGVGIDHRNKK